MESTLTYDISKTCLYRPAQDIHVILVTFIEPCSKATRPEQWQSTGIPPCCPEKGSADAVFKSSQTFKLNISTS